MEADILSAIKGQCEEFWIFFLHSPVLTLHTFPLKMMVPKNLMSVASQGLQNKGGLIGPPRYLEVSLRAVRDRVNQ